MSGAQDARQVLAAMVTAPKFDRPWRPAPPAPLSLSELARVRDALKDLDRRPVPSRG